MQSERPFSPSRPAPSRWAWIRAFLITVVVGFNFIQASPAPGKVSKTALKDPIAMEELGRWVDLFAWFGVETTPEAISQWTVGLADNWKAGKRFIATPIRPFWTFTATQQGWGLFTYPDTHPYEMEIQIRGNEMEYQTIFLSQDPDLDFQWALLTFRRFRGMYNPGRRAPKTYNGVTKFLAKRAFETYPDASRVRVRFRRLHTTLPGLEPDEIATVRFSRTIKRSDVE